MQGGKVPPPGPFGSANLHGRTQSLFNPNLFPPGSIQAMTVQRILQDPASFAQFYSHIFGPEGSDDDENDDDHSCCPCCSGQSFEDRMIATITRFINPIVTADHAEDARQKIHCKVDEETEMSGVLEALQFWCAQNMCIFNFFNMQKQYVGWKGNGRRQKKKMIQNL